MKTQQLSANLVSNQQVCTAIHEALCELGKDFHRGMHLAYHRLHSGPSSTDILMAQLTDEDPFKVTDMVDTMYAELDALRFLAQPARQVVPRLHPACSAMGVETVFDLLRFGYKQLMAAELIDEQSVLEFSERCQKEAMQLEWWMH